MKLSIKNNTFFKLLIILFIVSSYGCKFNSSNEVAENEKASIDSSNIESLTSDKLNNNSDTLKEAKTLYSSNDTLYDFIGGESEGLTLVEKNGFYGFINKKGKEVIPLKFEDAQIFSEGLAAVKKEGKWGYINLKGNFVINPTYDIATSFSEGLAAIRDNFLWGYINKRNRMVIGKKYDFAYPFSNGSAQVMQGTTWITINKRGKETDNSSDS